MTNQRIYKCNDKNVMTNKMYIQTNCNDKFVPTIVMTIQNVMTFPEGKCNDKKQSIPNEM